LECCGFESVRSFPGYASADADSSADLPGIIVVAGQRGEASGLPQAAEKKKQGGPA
jgi:hypothetical protein